MKVNKTIKEQLVEQITGALFDLLTQHIDGIRDNVDDNSRSNVGVAVRLDFSGKTPHVKVAIRYGVKVSDEVEFKLEDPEQPKLPV